MATRLRIRSRLLIWLFIAGALPLLVASFYSLRVVRSRVDANLAQETGRSLRIGLNLVLTWVERLSADAARLGRDPELRTVLRRYKTGDVSDPVTLERQIGGIIERYRERIAFGQVVLVDRKERVITRMTIDKGPAGVSGAGKGPAKTPTKTLVGKAGRNRFLHSVNIVPGVDHPMIRARAPVVDDDFEVLGTVLVLMPLDHRFADVIRATLGMHVGFYLLRRAAASSFIDEKGRSVRGLKLSGDLLDRVLRGQTRIGVSRLGDTEYSVGALPLVNAQQKPLGLFYVALDRQALERGKLRSYRSLLLFGGGVFLLAFLIASWASRDLSRPLNTLHERAMAVARGDLEGRIGLPPGDELGDLGQAFDDMTESLRENQRRLSARIGEIVTLHNIGRAVSSVVGLEGVLRTVVEEIRGALRAQSMAVLLADAKGRLAVGSRVGEAGDDEEGAALRPGSESGVLTGLRYIAHQVFTRGDSLCVDEIEDHPELGEQARLEGLSGSMMIVPLEHKGQRLGVMIVNRRPPAPAFGEAELRLLSTFADQASTAIENARLYEEVTIFNERLEQMVAERTAELTRTNDELKRALEDLQETQAQLLLSERLAGLGQLVAGIAHEVNTPAAAIQGATTNLDRSLIRLLEFCRQLANLGLSVPQWNAFIDEVSTHAARTELRVSATPAEARQRVEELTNELAQAGVHDARRIARRLVDLGAAESALRLVSLTGPEDVVPLVGCLQELVLLRRNGLAISTAIGTINRIVSALRAYCHLDQTRVDPVNLHDGIETTLVILGSRLKQDVKVVRRFAELPAVRVYVDELNQVWTNLIVNAADAAGERGEIVIETERQGDEVVVRIIDNGPGIPPEVLPRIFKPFFTTKPKGMGTGLGLGIVRRIVEKHGGRIEALSKPGRTCFSVHLPLAGPPPLAAASAEEGAPGVPIGDGDGDRVAGSGSHRPGTVDSGGARRRSTSGVLPKLDADPEGDA